MVSEKSVAVAAGAGQALSFVSPAAGDLAQGNHEITVKGIGLPPSPAQPYILVVADADGSVLVSEMEICAKTIALSALEFCA